MKFLEGFFKQIEITNALVLRETRTRFGANQLGYIWAMLEPLLFIFTFAVMFFLAKRSPPNGMDAIGFLTTGMLPFLLFRQTVNKTMAAISANKALLFYPQIRPLDLVIARTALEISTHVAVFTIIMFFNSLVNENFAVHNVLLVLAGLIMAGLLGAAVGLTFCALSVFSNSIERIQGPLLRPLFWISGCFFTANQLSSNVRDIFLWNPVLHTIEMVRGGYFSAYIPQYISYEYLVLFILGVGFIGLTLERVARRKLEII